MLAGTSWLPWASWAEVAWGRGPVNVSGLQIAESEERDPLLLILDRAFADPVNQIGCRD